jgi:hypothetical protein
MRGMRGIGCVGMDQTEGLGAEKRLNVHIRCKNNFALLWPKVAQKVAQSKNAV